MGLFKVIDNKQVQIALWRITETEQELKDLTGMDLSEKYSHPHRRIETMVVRALLNHLNHFESINYHPNGRPFYSTGTHHISISHTTKMVAVALSQNMSVGIDIEQVSRNFKTVAKRYLTDDEFKWINLNHQESLALAWCIKESIYKLPWSVNKSFTSDINILEFKDLSSNGVVQVEVIDLNITHHLELKYLFFDEFCLSWVLLETDKNDIPEDY
jgi:4'-phosphopantetheinyl transferase